MRTTFLCVTCRASSSSRLKRRSMSCAAVGSRDDLRPDHLDGDRDPELRVPGLIDSAHAADAELTQDVIPRPELLPDGEWSEGSLWGGAGRGWDTGRIRALVDRAVAAEHGLGVVWVHRKAPCL